MLVAEAGGIPGGFSALGERGKPAERVADEVVDALQDFLKTEAACDPHLADQLILPMALAGGTSRLTTSRVTPHLLTTVRIVQQILGCPVQIGGEEGSPGHVTIEGLEPRAESRGPSAQRRRHAVGVPNSRSEIRHSKSQRGRRCGRRGQLTCLRCRA